MNEPQQNQPAQHPQPGQPSGQPYAQPGQPYAQPGQSYAQPGQPYPPSIAGQSPRSGSSSGFAGLGAIALLVAALSVAVGLAFQLVTPWLYASGGYAVVDSFSLAVNLLVLLGAVGGLVLGLIALRRPAPQVLAAIAVGFAGAAVLSRLVAWASSLFYAFGF